MAITELAADSGHGVDGMEIVERVLRETCPHLLDRDCEYLFLDGRLREEVLDPLGHMSRSCHNKKYFQCETYNTMEGEKIK